MYHPNCCHRPPSNNYRNYLSRVQRKEMENLDTPTSLYEEFLASLRSSLSYDSHDLSDTSHDSREGSPDQMALTWRLDPLAQKYLSYLPVQLEKPAEW